VAIEDRAKRILLGAGQDFSAVDERPPAEVRRAPPRQFLRLIEARISRTRHAVVPDAKTGIEDRVENAPLRRDEISHICAVWHFF
jgi:hypothetical protein